jgi:alanine-glyoxylate transaminase / serine-glyoxylate transaminase / serine-pyruvate transaminase
MSVHRGRHFLQIPGPANVPDRVLRAIAQPTIDHRGPDFARLAREVIDGLRFVFQTRADIIVHSASGSGGWESALVNTLSPGDRILMCDTGHFAASWRNVAVKLGFDVELIPGDWRHGVDAAAVGERLEADKAGAIKAVAVVHNETSTGITSRIVDVRRAIDGARHGALLMVDAVSSLGSIEYRHDEWGVDVTISGSQKGLMLPPGLGLLAVSERARRASKSARMPRAFWDWEPMLADNAAGFFPYTPSTNLLFGLREALAMLREEGLSTAFARHRRFGEATRRAVGAWGLELVCRDPEGYSNSITAVIMPPGHDADALRALILERFDMSLGTGLGRLKGKAFRIGHLGDFNDLMLVATLGGVEMGLAAAGVPFTRGGVSAALAHLETAASYVMVDG